MNSTVGRLLGRSRGVLDEIHPLTESAVSTGVRYYATARVEAARLLGALRYDAPLAPRQLYEVDPQQIERTVSWTSISADRKAAEHPRFRRPKYLLAGRVFGGDWDRSADHIADSTIQESFRRHFEAGLPWEATQFYAETLEAIEAGAILWDCRSEGDLQQRCDRLDTIYERMVSEGYLSQTELHERGETAASDHEIFRRIWAEISVNIGRDGEFIFQDGRNRLAIARVIGLDTVPVVVLVRHAEWQRTRDAVARGDIERAELPERLRDHPDLVDLF